MNDVVTVALDELWEKDNFITNFFSFTKYYAFNYDVDEISKSRS